MPSRTLSKMMIAPSSRKTAATTISAVFRLNAAPPLPGQLPPPRPSMKTRRRATPCRAHCSPVLLRDEPRGLHERHVPCLFPRHPVGVLLAGERRLVERATLHQILPFRGRADLLAQVGIEADLLPFHFRRHE